MTNTQGKLKGLPIMVLAALVAAAAMVLGALISSPAAFAADGSRLGTATAPLAAESCTAVLLPESDEVLEAAGVLDLKAEVLSKLCKKKSDGWFKIDRFDREPEGVRLVAYWYFYWHGANLNPNEFHVVYVNPSGSATQSPSPEPSGDTSTPTPLPTQGGGEATSTPEPSTTVDSGATVAPTEPGDTSTPTPLPTQGGEVTPAPDPSTTAPQQPAGPVVQRVAGKDRVATAIAAYRAGDFQSDTVVLVSGKTYPDALAAAPLAAQRKAPILVTTSPQLEPSILQVLQEKQVARVVIVGGERSVPAAVANRLQGEGFKVERLAGANRFATAVEAAKAVGALRPNQKVFVVDGTNFADALSVGAVANKHGGAILLSSGKQLSPETLNHLKATNLDVVAVGGNAAASLKGYGGPGKVSQVVGVNRYQTAVKVAEQFAPGAKYAAVVSGGQFADALGAAAFAARNGGVLLLTPGSTLDEGTANHLSDSPLEGAYVVGGEKAVSGPAFKGVEAALRK